MSDNKPRTITIDPEIKEKYEQLINKTVCWIIIDKDGKSKVNISELGNTVLEVHNCIIVENGNKDDFYEYNKVKGYWELRNIKSIKSVYLYFSTIDDRVYRQSWINKFDKFDGLYIERIEQVDIKEVPIEEMPIKGTSSRSDIKSIKSTKTHKCRYKWQGCVFLFALIL